MSELGAPTRSLRRRLIVLFVLTAGLAAGLLAISSYLLVARARDVAVNDRVTSQTRFNLALAGDILTNARQRATELERLLSLYARRGTFETVVVWGEDMWTSSEAFGFDDVPPEVRRARSDMGKVEINGHSYIVSGGTIPDTDATAYYLFSVQGVEAQLQSLRNVLIGSWVIVMFAASLVGRHAARRTLAPVARTSEAARALAEGLLDTRLKVESADEFGKLAVAFNEMADALQAKLTELSDAHERERRFTSDVSHELRTPVAGLISAASMLNDRLDQMDDETRHVAEILILAARNLRVLVEELMEIARLDSRKAGVVRDSVDLPDVIDDVVQTHGWHDKVRLNGDPSLTIATDRRRLERVITNLIDNGITHGRPPVSVCVRRQDSKVEIEVNDAGDGISPNDVDHIFDRFYKGDRSRSASGSGLGLAIARDNARLIGGTVTVESEVGIGPRFIVTLPVA